MKKSLNFKIDERHKAIAKRHARIERKLFSDYCEEAYRAGIELKEFARINNVSVEDVIFYLNNSISGSQVRNGISPKAIPTMEIMNV